MKSIAHSTRVLVAFLAIGYLGASLFAAEDDVYKWYYHTEKVNETSTAIKAALDNNCGLLVVVGKPDCSTCAKVMGKDYMDVDGKLLAYMKQHHLVGLVIEDSQNHTQSIGSGINSYYNYDKTKTDKNVPFLLLVKPKESSRNTKSFETLQKKTDIDVFFGGFGSKTASGQTYKIVAAWLDLMLSPTLVYFDGRDNYATVYANRDQTPKGLVELVFFDTAESLGTMLKSGDEVWNTGNGVRKTSTSLSSSNKERWFKFHGEAGKRYVFSVTSADAAWALDRLQAHAAQITCGVYSIGEQNAPSDSPVYSKSTKGFKVLDEGFFFEPAATADYYLKVAASGTLAENVPFALRYHWSRLDGEGSLGQPFWSGVEPGKWSMDFDKAVEWSATNNKPFLLYFAALAWCPHCLSMEHLVLDTDDFSCEFPMVVMDNRRRGETTGPALLYCETYQNYIIGVDASITAQNVRAKMDAKLAENQRIQQSLVAPGANPVRIGYPTYLLVQATAKGSGDDVDGIRAGEDNQYAVNVIARSKNTYEFPVDTNFKVFAETFLARLDLRGDSFEETDNFVQNITKVPAFYLGMKDGMFSALLFGSKIEDTITGSQEATWEFDSLIGGYDSTDWRRLEFTAARVDGRFTVQGNFDAEAEITLKVFNPVDSTSVALAKGTAAQPPVLELEGKGGSYRLEISVSGQQEVIPYTLFCTALRLPPYEIGFAQEIYYARRATGTAELPLDWKTIKDENPQAKISLALSNGTCADGNVVTIQAEAPNKGEKGTEAISITGLTVAATATEPATATLTLGVVDQNSRIVGANPVEIRTYALPAFPDFSDGAVKSYTLIENTAFKTIYLPLVNGLTDKTTYEIVSGSLPTGVNLKLVQREGQPGFADLVLSGTPKTASAVPQTITIQLYTVNSKGQKDKAGATLTLSFAVHTLEEVNPTAFNTTDYTGYLVDEDGLVMGTFEMNRQQDSSFKVQATFVTDDVAEYDALPWMALLTEDAYIDVDQDGETVPKSAVYTEVRAKGEPDSEPVMYLFLSSSGDEGTGIFGEADSAFADFHVSFLPNMSAEEATANYQGQYSVSLESSHPDYKGFGWLKIDVGGDGAVEYSGALPNGVPFSGATHLVEENGQGVLTVVALAESEGTMDYASGRVQIIPLAERTEGEPCVSACSSALALFWYDFAYNNGEGLSAKLTPCGAIFDPEKTFKEQATGYEGEYFYFYAFTQPYYRISEEFDNLPDSFIEPLLPAGIRIEEIVGERRFRVKDGDNDSGQDAPFVANAFAGLDFQMSYGVDARFTGSFQTFDKDGQPRTVEFKGILTPVPASCCSIGAAALGYGYILEGEASWPVRITMEYPDDIEGRSEALKNAPEVNAMADGVNVTETEGGAYVLLDSEGKVVACSTDGRFVWNWKGLANPGEYSIVLVANGLQSEASPAVTLAEAGRKIGILKTAAENLPEGKEGCWYIFSMPDDYVPRDEDTAIVGGDLVFAYDENQNAWRQVSDWKALEPGQAFLAYVRAGDGRECLFESQAGVDIAAAAPEANKFLLWKVPAQTEYWKWDAGTGGFMKDTAAEAAEGEEPAAGWVKLPQAN